jgi:putative ABC transport system ATP-binding protein
MDTVARLRQASKEYWTGDTLITALQPATLDLFAHQLTLIIGPSGSGKTTLLSLVGCVIFPTRGEVYVAGQRINDMKQRQLAAVRLKHIGFVFQSFNLLAPLNGLENVMQPLLLMGVSKKVARHRAVEALEKVDMVDRMKNLPRALSGGQQQRVAIARALVSDPAIILCDEPTAALDAKSAATVMAQLRQLADAGKSVAIVTHDLRLRPYADRIIYVNDGYVSETPPAGELLQ